MSHLQNIPFILSSDLGSEERVVKGSQMRLHRFCQIWENTFVGVEKRKMERVPCVSAWAEKSSSILRGCLRRLDLSMAAFFSFFWSKVTFHAEHFLWSFVMIKRKWILQFPCPWFLEGAAGATMAWNQGPPTHETAVGHRQQIAATHLTCHHPRPLRPTWPRKDVTPAFSFLELIEAKVGHWSRY